MQVSVEAPSALQRRLTVKVPMEQYDEAFAKRLSTLAKTAKMKGFRPGNVPMQHLKKMYGDSVKAEALSDVIQNSLYAAITQESLVPVNTPTVEAPIFVSGQPIEFVATFEVMPTIKDISFTVSTIEKETAIVTEADVEAIVERLQGQHVTWKKVEDRAAQDKDQVVIDFKGAIDGTLFPGGQAHDFSLIIGSNSMIPGFEDGVVGMKVGDEKVIKVTFPADYHAADLAGKQADFTLKAHKISEPNLPLLNETFVKKLGIKTGKLEDLKIEIKKNLDREVERVIKAKLKAQVFNLLIEQNPCEVPLSMVEKEAQRIHQEMHPHHKHEDHGHTAEEMQQFTEGAKRNVTLSLLISKFVEQHQLTPAKERVQEHLNKLAASYEKPEDVMQWYNSDKKRLNEIEMYILEDQVIEKLLMSVAISEKILNYRDIVNQ